MILGQIAFASVWRCRSIRMMIRTVCDGHRQHLPADVAAVGGGDAFYVDGQLYRPAQDCNKWYGNGLNIQKVIKDGDHFAFETVNTFHSDNPSYALGYHTLNMKNGLIVVDGHRYRFPCIAKILMAASHILSVSTQRRTLQ